MSRQAVPAFLFLVLLVGLSASTHARPNYKAALSTYVGAPIAKRLNDCRTCHSPANGDDPSAVNARTLNVFGIRLRKVLPELRAAKKRAGISNRLEAVADEDTDGDGASNLLELLTGRFPGDASDRPTPEELERGQTVLAAFRRARPQK